VIVAACAKQIETPLARDRGGDGWVGGRREAVLPPSRLAASLGRYLAGDFGVTLDISTSRSRSVWQPLYRDGDNFEKNLAKTTK
jgi:hypothetical protein